MDNNVVPFISEVVATGTTVAFKKNRVLAYDGNAAL